MDITLKCDIHTPEMTRFINATYYRGRYRERVNCTWEQGSPEIPVESSLNCVKRGRQNTPV